MTSRRSGMKMLPVVGGIVLAIVALSFAAYTWYPPVTRLVDGVLMLNSLPESLRGVTFVRLTNEGKPTFLKGNGIGLVESVPTFKPGVSLSPDGNKQTLAIRTATTTPAAAIDFSEWRIVIAPARDEGETKTLAFGYAPHFISDSEVVYFTQSGIALYDATTEAYKLISPFPTTRKVGGIVQYSPDGTLVLWQDVASRQYVLARIDSQSYTELTTYPSLSYPLLLDTGVYDTYKTPEGTLVWHYRPDGTRDDVTIIPSSLAISSLQL